MSLIAGADGAGPGWLMVARQANGRIASRWVPTPADLCEGLADTVIAVDVPIGLTDSGPRLCDQKARKALGAPRASSVFSPPVRSVLAAETREGASNAQKQIDGRGISVQAWEIFPKIRAWDELLRGNPEIGKRVFEVHPEVCFWALNEFRPMQHRKKSPAGRQERRELLVREFGTATLDETRSHHARREVADDDLHDAFVALWTASRIYAGVAKCFPEAPEYDSSELPMAIWY